MSMHHTAQARRRRLAAVALAILCGVTLLAACSRPPRTKPAEVRVVALSPAIAIIVQRLGHEGLVVGRHAYDMSLPKFIPVAGDQSGIDYESLIALQPTIVLTQWGSRQLPERLVTLAREEGWTLHDAPLLALEDIPAATAHIDRLIAIAEGKDAPTAAGSRLVADMQQAWRPRGDLARAGRVLLLASMNPPAALGPGSFHHDILVRIGGTPAITEGSPYIELDREDIRALNPDAIVLVKPVPEGTTPPVAAEAMASIADLPIRAVMTQRLHIVTDELSLTPSPSMIEFADELARVLGTWSLGGT
jgi:ABC-type hemin transport system substrate-binding protein